MRVTGQEMSAMETIAVCDALLLGGGGAPHPEVPTEKQGGSGGEEEGEQEGTGEQA